MGAFPTYFWLEIKKALKMLPRFLAGATVLAGLLGAVALSASREVYGNSAAGRIEVGVVLPENDRTAGMAISMLSSLDSVKSLCDFTYIEEEEGRERLKSGEFYALMIVPEGFIQDILDGTNTPVPIILPRGGRLESLLFRELADAGARVLSVSQAAIYAADEFAFVGGAQELIPEIEGDLNRLYLGYALPRADYFRYKQVSASGDVTMIQYYGTAMTVLFLLLCAIPAYPVLKPSGRALAGKLRMAGIGRIQITWAKTCACCLLILTAALIPAAAALGMGAVTFSWSAVVSVVILCFTISCMMVFLYHLADSPVAGMMMVFLLSVGMIFFSGGFIPSIFLPEGVRELSPWMPTTLFIRVVKGVLTDSVSWRPTGSMCLMSLAFFTASVLIRRSDG